MLKRLLLMFSLMLILMLVSVGCGTKVQHSYGTSDTQPTENRIATNPEEAKLKLAGDGTVVQKQAQPKPAGIRKIVKQAAVFIDAADIKKSLNQVTGTTAALSGFVQSSSSGERDREYYTDLIIRVPADKFDQVITGLEAVGKITAKTITGQDVTEEYFDTDARKRNLELQEGRLLEILRKTGTVSEILEVERELARVRGEIEQLTGRLKVLDNLTELSTIEIHLRQAKEFVYQSGEGQPVLKRSAAAFKNSIRFIADLGKGLVVAAGGLLPFTPVIALAVLGLRRLIKGRKKSA